MDRQQVEYVERENAFLREQLHALTDQIETVKQDVLEEGAKHIRGKENTVQKMKELEREIRQAKANTDKWKQEAMKEKQRIEELTSQVERLQGVVNRAKSIPFAGKLVTKLEQEGKPS
ncbi:hypothetical protein EVJ30_09325 [Exiguobacterium sp. SH5S13]|uniref:hypothetical protein n=1 Tax=unclassified Exiguobacterium TaxID=2644629 RepID=UPI00103B4F05|nr:MULTISPECIES: hypothetical protein [unclassified Exiguobacterium]TCI27151.1 hypothetical protein EVJ32_02865 [Exiguobacterium sp. SH5S4]TCI52838.1 hypothetical protein EVJ30_09325 [Exiguobacterium sp. SH5S13]